MSGKTLVWLVMLGGLASAWFAGTHADAVRSVRNWAQSRITGTDPSYTERQFEQDLVDRINFVRRNSKRAPVQVDGELQQWLTKASDQIKSDELDSAVKLVQREQPRYFELSVSSASSSRLSELAEKFAEIAAGSSPNSHHMAVLTRPQPRGYGYEAVLVMGQRLENFSPEALSAKTSDTFFSRCPHCKASSVIKVSFAQRGLNLECTKCGLDYGVVSPDERGCFRYVNEFLTGYHPPTYYAADSSKLHEMFTIWSAVVSSYVYTKDTSPSMPNRDSWQTALETMVRGKGDCEDSSILLADWLISRGFDVRVALGRYGDIGQHAWCVVRIDNVDYLLESTEGPPNIDKLPFVNEVGARYVPETLFDRDNIYVRSKPRERFDGNYWASKSWLKVQPRHLFDEATIRRPLLASSEATDSTPTTSRPVITGTRTRGAQTDDPTGTPMPPFQRLKELAPGAARWQLVTPIGK